MKRQMGKEESKASSTQDLGRFSGSLEVFEAIIIFGFVLSVFEH